MLISGYRVRTALSLEAEGAVVVLGML